MIVHLGKEQDHPKPSISMYHIQGSSKETIRALQVPLHTSVLTSNSIFVLLNPSGTSFIWKGKCSSQMERDFALAMTNQIQTQEIEEGNETSTFWQHLAGEKGAYPIKSLNQRISPRLFQCSISTGVSLVCLKKKNFSTKPKKKILLSVCACGRNFVFLSR